MTGTRRTFELMGLTLVVCLAASACSAPEAERLEDQSGFHVELAYGHWAAGEVPQAIEELQLAVAIEPENPDAHYMLGFVFSGRQMFSEAIQHYRQALLLQPDWHECQNNLGVVFLQLERWEDAIPLFEELTNIPSYQTPGHAHNNLGWAQLQLGRTREALSNFQMAQYLQPDLCLSYNNEGIALLELEREREAIEAFENAVQRCDSYAEPRFYLARLRQAEGLFAEAETLFRECSELVPEGNLGRRCREYLQNE